MNEIASLGWGLLVLGLSLIALQVFYKRKERTEQEGKRQIRERSRNLKVLRLDYRFSKPRTRIHVRYRETNGKSIHADIRTNIGSGGFVVPKTESNKPHDEMEVELDPGDYTVWFSCAATEEREVSYQIEIVEMKELGERLFHFSLTLITIGVILILSIR